MNGGTRVADSVVLEGRRRDRWLKKTGFRTPAASFRGRAPSSFQRWRRHRRPRSRGYPRQPEIAGRSDIFSGALSSELLEAELANDDAHTMICGGRRSTTGTDRRGTRNWPEVRAYLVVASGSTSWPKDTILLRDYLRGLAA